jgi:hypothetical protein
MGQSTDAILVFGFDVGEENPLQKVAGDDEDDSPELDVILAARAGLVRPSTADYKAPEWTKYWAEKEALEKASPLEIVRHCSGDYPMYIMAVRGTKTRANRGYPSVIDPAALAVTPEKIEAAKALCAELGIEWQEPKWLLCSMWD